MKDLPQIQPAIHPLDLSELFPTYSWKAEDQWLTARLVEDLVDTVLKKESHIFLSLNGYQIEQLDDTVFVQGEIMNHLQYLDLGGNHLARLPKSIECLEQLTVLIIDDNYLDFLDFQQGSYSQLQRFSARNNRLIQVSIGDGVLPRLQVLDLSYNSLQGIPLGIENTARLSELYLKRNKIKRLNGSLKDLSALKVLDISSNLLEAEGVDELPKDNLYSLDICENVELHQIPECVFNCSALEELDGSAIGMIEVAQDIQKLARLKFLCIANNQLTQLPNAILQLKCLEHLDISRNQFSDHLIEFPEQLLILDISSNDFTQLPESVTRLPKLIFLDISENRQMQIDTAQFAKMSQLEVLNIYDIGTKDLCLSSLLQLSRLVRLTVEVGGQKREMTLQKG